jgi:1-acyl-sn-glycerol-3-phosphate acyltransferase
MKLYFILPYIMQIIVAKIIIKIFFNFNIKGIENLRGLSNGVIFASNHASELDPILVTASIPISTGLLPLFYVSKDKSFYNKMGWRRIFYGGFIFKICGAYPSYSGVRDYGTSLSNHIKFLEDGYSLCIFPQGKRVKNGEVSKIKGGVAYLSYKTKKPIIPVAIFDIPRISLINIFFKRKLIQVKIGRPLYVDDLFNNITPIDNDRTEYHIVAERIMSEIFSLKNS